MIKRPLITEKSTNLTKLNLYTFEVSKEMDKKSIAQLVKDKFSVDVISVKTVKIHPKKRTQRSRKGFFTQPGMKKALVQVKKGQKIALFETEKKAEVQTAETEEAKTLKEKKNLLKGTKVKVEKVAKEKEEKISKPKSKKEEKKKTTKEKSIEKKKGKK